MKIDFSTAVKNGLKYSILKDRVAIYFALLAVYMIGMVYPMYRLIGAISGLAAGGGPEIFITLIGPLLTMIFVIFIFTLISIWVNMAYVQDYATGAKQGGLMKAFSDVKKYYWRMLAVTIVIVIISALLGAIPYIGWIFSFLLSWVFLFATQFVILGNKKFRDVFSTCWETFKQHHWDIVVLWVVGALVGMVIMGIFAIPLIGMSLSIVLPYLMGNNPMGALTAFMDNLALIGIGAFIALIGASISTVFSVGFFTDGYLQIFKKKK
ncbi:MAG: hypothetical protein ABIG20_05120 [archaeon]